MTYFIFIYILLQNIEHIHKADAAHVHQAHCHYKAGLAPLPPGGGGDVGALFAVLVRGFVS